MTQITLKSVGLRYPLFSESARSLRAIIGSALLGRKNVDVQPQYVQALDDLTISLNSGTRLGLIGPNGAGKSTLLRVLAGIYQPTEGVISREGKTVSIFDLNFGMDEEASGMENIAIAGTMLGLSRNAIAQIKQEITDFSELNEALNRPIKTYSTGMRVRLTFGLATSLHADILLIDEIIGVGDAQFMKKASARIVKQAQGAKITVLASHAESVLRDFCDLGLVISGGKMLYWGPLDDALRFYNSSYA